MELKILNEHNIYITEDVINNIFSNFNFDHKVKNIEMYQRAMVHKSYMIDVLTDKKKMALLQDVEPIDIKLVSKCVPLQTHSYERLEFLGDSIIRHALTKYLFTRYENEDEGFLTRNRSKLENKFALSELAKKLKLHKYAIISRKFELANGRTNFVNITEDIFESFIGALNLEVGDDKTVEFISKIIEKEVDFSETIRTNKNYKSMLMHYFSKNNSKYNSKFVSSKLNHYTIEPVIDSNGKKKCKASVICPSNANIIGVGIGKCKKSAQQKAAKAALLYLGILNKNNNDDDESIEYSDPENIANVNMNNTGVIYNSDDDYNVENPDDELKKTKLFTK